MGSKGIVVIGIRSAIVVVGIWAAAGMAFGHIACTSQQAKTVADVSLTIADGVCKEIAGPTEPEWVLLACAVEGVASGVVKVAMPRRQWQAMRAPHDAGPGK